MKNDSCVWHEERFYTVGPMLRNSAGDLVDGKPWVSMPLSRNGFTMPTRVTDLAFEISTNVCLALLTSYSHYMHEARSASWLIERVWLCNDHLLSQGGA